MRFNRENLTIPNLLSFYRLITFPLIMYLTFCQQQRVFAILLIINLITDALDGIIARAFRCQTELGAKLDPIELQTELPVGSLGIILSAEAAAAFDELTRSNADELLVRQIKNAWPNVFRSARFIPAVEYINANRIRYQLLQEMHALMKDFDVVVTPSFAGNQLLITNLTGHPCVVVPTHKGEDGRHSSISFLGNLFDEATILTVAKAYQEATNFDEMHPPGF